MDEALQQLEPQFRKRYSHTRRVCIAPERLLRTLLLGHLVRENRHGLIVAAAATKVSTGARRGARQLLEKLKRRLPVKT